MIIKLDPHNIERDDLFTFEVFLDNLQLKDLLVFRRMINTEFDRRVEEKVCICTIMEAGEFDAKYLNTSNKPETIQWIRNSDGMYETGRLKYDEIHAKVKCQCGEYMKTYPKVGRYKIMIAECVCDNPKPMVMECDLEITSEPAKYARSIMDQRVVAKGRLLKPPPTNEDVLL